LQSPAFFPESSDKQEKVIYKEFLKQSGQSNLEGLRKASESDLEQANRNMTYNSPYGLFAFGPAVDDDYIKAPLSVLLKFNFYWKDIEIFLAHTGNEGLLFTPPWIQDDDGFKNHVKAAFPDMPSQDIETLLKLYPSPTNGPFLHRRHVQRVADAMADVAVVCNTGYLLDAYVKQWTYKYVFDISPSIHGQDCSYTVRDFYLGIFETINLTYSQITVLQWHLRQQ
jgi:carboxylesterase type B